MADILTDLQEAQQHNADIQRQADLAAELSRQDDALQRRIAQLMAEIDEAQTQLSDVLKRQEAASIAAEEPRIDLAPIQARLAAVDETNATVRAVHEYTRTAAELAAASEVVAEAQLDLDSIEDRKREALAAAVFPVDGLSVDENGVTFDGVPFTQVNSAMRRRVAFAIATAGDPKLRLVIVKDGDLLDADSLAAIRSLADERGYTVLVERDRDESRQIGFTIEDGALA